MVFACLFVGDPTEAIRMTCLTCNRPIRFWQCYARSRVGDGYVHARDWCWLMQGKAWARANYKRRVQG